MIVLKHALCGALDALEIGPNHALAANGGGPSRFASSRLVAGVAELGSLGLMNVSLVFSGFRQP